MNPKIFYRKSSRLMDGDELKAAKDNFEIIDSVTQVKPGDFIIPRYSLWPYASDVIRDIELMGGKTINSYEQTLYISDLKNYVSDLKELTPMTWDKIYDLPDDGTKFILKGETSSKKYNWQNMMYASDKKEAGDVYSKLCDDGLIGSQQIYIREYVPLKTYYIGCRGLPITEEYRFFVYNKKVISKDFYWAGDLDLILDRGFYPDVNDVPNEFISEVITRVGDNSNGYVIDVARTNDNRWIVIELNQLEQSGLSCNDPNILYENLKKAL